VLDVHGKSFGPVRAVTLARPARKLRAKKAPASGAEASVGGVYALGMPADVQPATASRGRIAFL
jgi:hypothetical protein